MLVLEIKPMALFTLIIYVVTEVLVYNGGYNVMTVQSIIRYVERINNSMVGVVIGLLNKNLDMPAHQRHYI